MSKITSIIFCLLFFPFLNAQIRLEVNSAVSGKKFKIAIEENSEKYFLTLNIRDSISKSKMYENAMDKYRSEFFKIKDYTITNDSVITLLNKMDSLTEKNTFYSIYKTEFIKKKI